MNRAVCHYPWDTLYIEPDGAVFFCCHKKPYCIGNIYSQSLEQIMIGLPAAKARRESREGTLACFEKCTRAPSRRYYNAGNERYPVPSEPRIKEVHINISTRCNISCVMCRQDHKSREALDYKKLIAAVNWDLSPRLIIQGGEPLVVPAARKLADFVASSTNSRLTLITNGTALTGKWRSILVSGGHECRFSLNGASRATHEAVNRGSSWPRVMAGVRKLAALREKKSSRLYITLRMTVVPINASEMAAFVRFANEEGYANRIAFGFDKKTMPKWARRHPDEFRRIYDEFMGRVTESKILCDAWRLYQLARTEGFETRDFSFGPKGQLLPHGQIAGVSAGNAMETISDEFPSECEQIGTGQRHND